MPIAKLGRAIRLRKAPDRYPARAKKFFKFFPVPRWTSIVDANDLEDSLMRHVLNGYAQRDLNKSTMK